MSEINIIEVLINAIKKGRIFEKTEKYKKAFYSFIFFTSVANAFLLATNLYNLYTMMSLKKSMKKLKNIESKIEDLHKNLLHLYKLTDDKVTNINKSLIDLHCYKKSIANLICYVDNSTEINETNDETNDTNDTNDETNETNDTIDELMDECYDNIPCNNIKKHTIFNTLLKW
jgi:hypothetical protein